MKKFVAKVISGFLVVAMLLGCVSFPIDVKADTTKRNNSYRSEYGWDINPSLADVPRNELPVLRGNLPSSYSSADTNISVEKEKDYVTSVKNQNPYGTCWAFSAISLAETSYIMNEGANPDNIDFNEYHLVHYTYNTPEDLYGITGKDSFSLKSTAEDASLDFGGNLYFAMQMFSNWVGISDSSSFDADDVDGEHSDALAYEDAAHLENAYILAMPDMTSNYQNDMDAIKSAIMEYGSIAASYYADGSWKEESGYYYYPFGCSGNHAVTIVGWNDTIASSNFTRIDTNGKEYKPAGNGAWLVKNSWGTQGSALDGYFWLSYYDMTIGTEAFVFDVTAEDNFDNNYHHDGSIFTDPCWVDSNTNSMASVFVADSVESLEAVGFYTQNTNLDYEIRVYGDLETDEKPQDGSLLLTNKGKTNYIGFHTVDLTENVSLKKGERYAVVVTLSKTDEYPLLTVSQSYNDDNFNVSIKAKAGESFVGDSVQNLIDLNSSNKTYADGIDVCIKAYTNEITVVPETGISLNHTTASLESGKSLQLNATVAPATATYKGVSYTSSDTSLATVNANGLVTANSTGKSGTATITATSEYSKKTATCTITVLPISQPKPVQPSVPVKPVEPVQPNVPVQPSDPTPPSVSVVNGWVNFNGAWYYLINGQIQTGWLLDNGTWYYMDNSGTMQTGWVKDGGRWYYMKSSGAMATGWIKDGGTWYFMNGSGAMQTGWIKDDGTWYYMNNSGAMATGWIKDGGTWYYMKTSGAMATGWIKSGGTWYYMKTSGAMATGWIKTGGTWYYMNGSGAMVTGKQKIGGKTYYFNASGAWIR